MPHAGIMRRDIQTSHTMIGQEQRITACIVIHWRQWRWWFGAGFFTGWWGMTAAMVVFFMACILLLSRFWLRWFVFFILVLGTLALTDNHPLLLLWLVCIGNRHRIAIPISTRIPIFTGIISGIARHMRRICIPMIRMKCPIISLRWWLRVGAMGRTMRIIHRLLSCCCCWMVAGIGIIDRSTRGATYIHRVGSSRI